MALDEEIQLSARGKQIEVIFELSLAHPVWCVFGMPPAPIVMPMPNTGNTVYIDPPDATQIANPRQGTFNTLKLRVERYGDKPRDGFWEQYHFSEDAGRAFFALFDTLRLLYYNEHKVPGYPVVASGRIQGNPLVARCTTESRYNGKVIARVEHTGIEAIEISGEHWDEARRRLAAGTEVPAYIGFAIDAMYFAHFDPIRAIVMANAAWETAMRYYLATVAATKDSKYLAASKLQGIPRLLHAVKEARGGSPFFELILSVHPLEQKMGHDYRKLVAGLPTLRNQLVHQGITPLSEHAALDSAIAVIYAIDWLFAA